MLDTEKEPTEGGGWGGGGGGGHLKLVEIEECATGSLLKAGQDIRGEAGFHALVKPKSGGHDIQALQGHDPAKFWPGCQRWRATDELLHSCIAIMSYSRN